MPVDLLPTESPILTKGYHENPADDWFGNSDKQCTKFSQHA